MSCREKMKKPSLASIKEHRTNLTGPRSVTPFIIYIMLLRITVYELQNILRTVSMEKRGIKI